MRPDDPRHGTNAGYIAHALDGRDYCQPCRDAHRNYRKRARIRQLRTGSVLTDSLGTVRRVQALLALGHTHAAIAEAAGGSRSISKNALVSRYGQVHVAVAAAIDRAYDKLSMTVPSGWRADERRRRAVSLGYLPPLAWDDIDDPDEQPMVEAAPPRAEDVDHVAVERRLAGDRTVATSYGDRCEIVRRCHAAGLSDTEGADLTGLSAQTFLRIRRTLGLLPVVDAGRNPINRSELGRTAHDREDGAA